MLGSDHRLKHTSEYLPLMLHTRGFVMLIPSHSVVWITRRRYWLDTGHPD
jgi:hypothetical protein